MLWTIIRKGTDRNISSKHKLKEVNKVTKVSANRFKNCALTSSSNKKDFETEFVKKTNSQNPNIKMRTLKFLSIALILIVGMILTFQSCQKDEIILKDENSKQNLKVEKITINDFSSKKTMKRH